LILGDGIIARKSRSSTGLPTIRIFVEKQLRLAGLEKRVVILLVSRERMIHRLLLGREALAKDFVVDH
jgi:hypothetical protein